MERVTGSGWALTHRRWAVLHDIEQELTSAVEAGLPVRLPWRDDYADLFGQRAALVAMLRYHWRLAEEAQLDPDLPERTFDDVRHRLGRRFAGVQRLLAQIDASDSEVAKRLPVAV